MNDDYVTFPKIIDELATVIENTNIIRKQITANDDLMPEIVALMNSTMDYWLFVYTKDAYNKLADNRYIRIEGQVKRRAEDCKNNCFTIPVVD